MYALATGSTPYSRASRSNLDWNGATSVGEGGPSPANAGTCAEPGAADPNAQNQQTASAKTLRITTLIISSPMALRTYRDFRRRVRRNRCRDMCGQIRVPLRPDI